MGKQENIKIFEDTETLCKTNSSLKQSIKNSICNQKLILQNQRINSNNQKRYEKPANIIVSKKRTLQAASAYKNTKTAVHNFASATNPGGGVKRGSNAQEECLCRCSGLYVCLSTQTMWDDSILHTDKHIIQFIMMISFIHLQSQYLKQILNNQRSWMHLIGIM